MDFKGSLVNRQPVFKNERLQDIIVGLKGPLTNLSWTMEILFLASRYSPGNLTIFLKSEELQPVDVGFLTCKVATVIASFRTIPTYWKYI